MCVCLWGVSVGGCVCVWRGGRGVFLFFVICFFFVVGVGLGLVYK